jgi:hypothetical protein
MSKIEHLNTLLLSKDSHIDSLKQAMLLLENHQAKLTESPAPWWKFWKKSVHLASAIREFLNLPKNRQISERSSPQIPHTTQN